MARKPLPWKIAEYGATGPLSDDQVSILSQRFGFDEQVLWDLSNALGWALHPTTTIRDLREMRDQRTRGDQDLGASIRELKKIEKMLLREVERDKTLKFDHEDQPDSVPAFRMALDLERAASLVHKNLSIKLSRRKLGRQPRHTGELNRHRAIDHRRRLVCNVVFDFWCRMGRELTLTSSFVDARRSGPLYDFTNAVVECVTEPPCPIKGEAVRQERDHFRASRQRLGAWGESDGSGP